MKIRLKINGVIIFLSCILLAAFPKLLLRSPSNAAADEVTEMLGVVFILLGQLLRVSARGYKSEHSGNGQILIQGGPYAFVRNPMYLGILCIGIGIVMALFNWWAMAIFLSIFVLRYISLIFKEEKKLSALFPEEYHLYRERIPRLIPSPAALKKGIYEYLPLKPLWIKKELGSILATLLVVFSLHAWLDIKAEGMRAYLEETVLFLAIGILFVFTVIYLIRGTEALKKDASIKSQNNL